MEEGTLSFAYTFPSYTTYTPPHNPIITGTLIPILQASFRDPKNFTDVTRDVVVFKKPEWVLLQVFTDMFVDYSFCADSD
jgi:hypothetical protein